MRTRIAIALLFIWNTAFAYEPVKNDMQAPKNEMVKKKKSKDVPRVAGGDKQLPESWY